MAKYVLRAPERALHSSEAKNPRWLASQLLFDFYLGNVTTGDRLPSVRELASQLRISPTTALDLYKELEAQNFVEGKERSGVFLKHVGLPGACTRREEAVFELLSRTTRRLGFLGVGMSDFARLLLRMSGAQPRTDFKFGFLSHLESCEIFTRELAACLGFELPVEPLPPGASGARAVRERLLRNGGIQCLITTYLYAGQAFQLAHEHAVSVIVLRLDASAAAIIEPPASGRRYLVMRDADCAGALRALICRVCNRHGNATCRERPAEEPSAEHVPYLPVICERTCVTALTDEKAMREIDREADVIHASPLIVERLRERYGTSKTVIPMLASISQGTVDEVLFQYLFGPLPAQGSVRGDRGAVNGPQDAD